MGAFNNITILFCEGPHDTAFLYRILKTKCYKVYNDTLSSLPSVVGKFIESKNKSEGYNKLKIDVLKNDFLPYRILSKEDRLILIYSFGGDKDNSDDEKNKRLIILKHFFNDISSRVSITGNFGEAFTSNALEGNSYKYSFLFFYDADKDKQEKIKIVNNYVNKLELNFTLVHNDILKNDDFSFGVYIFSDKEDKGALEDILFKIMKDGNEEIFEKADEYYENNYNEDRAKKLTTVCTDSQPSDKRKGGLEKDKKKSIIAIVGQLQKKGKSNVVIIEDSDYLTLKKIEENDSLQEIASFIEAGNI